jgi:hypothetical protein
MDHAPVHAAPSAGFVLGHEHDVGEHVEVIQRAAQPIRLLDQIPDRRLDHKEVEVAVFLGLASRMGAKEDHPRTGGQHPAGVYLPR